MKSRFLTATAALSVALSAMQPLPLLAQERRNLEECTPGEGDCGPGERKKPQREQRQRENREQPAEEQEQRRRPAEEAEAPADAPRQQRAQEGQEDGEQAGNRERREERRRARQQEQADAEARDAERAAEEAQQAEQPRRAEPEAEERQAEEPRRELPQAEERQAEEPAAAPQDDGERAANRERREERRRQAERDEADAEANREAERRAAERQQADEEREPAAAEEDGEQATIRERREERIRRAEQENAEADAAREDEQRDEASRDDENRDEDARSAEERLREDGNRRSDSERRDEEPSDEAVDRLNALISGRDGSGRESAAAAADDERGDRGRLIERRVTERDSRSSDEEFRNRVNEDDDNNDDDDDGLSDLQKFGLLALGGLAVGALMNNGDEVVSNSGDRVVVQQADGTYTVLKDDDTLIRRPGSDVQTRTYDDGSTRSVVLREDGSQIVTIRDASGRVLRRTRVGADGQEVYLINDLNEYQQVDISTLPEPRQDLRLSTREGSLREALDRIERQEGDRSYSLRQIRDYREVRDLAPSIDIEGINFNSGSAAIGQGEAEKLSDLGSAIADLIAERPNEIVLIEGHTDAVGPAAANLALSDRRAESVALALTEYFDVPPENLVVQGYGESDLVVDTETAARENRRATARIITPLMEQASAE